MRFLFWAALVEAFLVGVASMNAFWHPSPVTLGLLPMLFGCAAYVIYLATQEMRA